MVVESAARMIATAVLTVMAAAAGSAGHRRRHGDLTDEVAAELVDQLPERWMLVRVPALEKLAKAIPSCGHDPLIVLSPGLRQLDRAGVVSVDERTELELL